MTRTPMQRTPQYVLDSMYVIAQYLRQQEYEQVILSPNGGASFRVTSVFAELQGQHQEIRHLENELAKLRDKAGSPMTDAEVIDGLLQTLCEAANEIENLAGPENIVAGRCAETIKRTLTALEAKEESTVEA